MPLKEKGRWRRWLGLRGNIWYDRNPAEWASRFREPAVWSATIAAMSTLTTAIFAYQNYILSRQTFAVTHQPKLTAVWIRAIDEGQGVWRYVLRVRNDGDQPGEGVFATIPVGNPSQAFPIFIDFDRDQRPTIAAGEMNGLLSGSESIPPSVFPDPFQVDLFYGPGHRSLEVCGRWTQPRPGKKESSTDLFAALRGCEQVDGGSTPSIK